MSGKNNFQRLDDSGTGRGGPPESVRKNVNGSIRFIEYIGSIVELYLPNVFNAFKEMTNPGGKSHIRKNNHPTPPDLDNDPPGDNIEGGAASDDIFR